MKSDLQSDCVPCPQARFGVTMVLVSQKPESRFGRGSEARPADLEWELGFSVFNHFCICAFCFFKLEVRYLLSLALKLVDQLRIIRRLAHSQPISNSFKAEETRSGGTKL